MTVVSVSKLKASLSALLRRVKAGDEVLVTERGRVIARLSPATSSSSLREMERQGLVKIGTGKLPEDFWRMRRPKDPKGLVMKGVLEERAGGGLDRLLAKARRALPVRKLSEGEVARIVKKHRRGRTAH